jgi:DNA topoisomerase II
MNTSAADFDYHGVLDAARTSEMWAGPLVPTEDPDLRGVRLGPDGTPQFVSLADVTITPALLQGFVEACTNTSDHHHETVKAKLPRARRVTKIDIGFDPVSGELAVENNGPGIPIEVHPKGSEAAGRDVYVTELVFAIPLAGSKLHKSPDSITGGINGLGAKIINVHSKKFRVEVVGKDANGKLCGYAQEFSDRLRKREDPVLYPDLRSEGATENLTSAKEHTRIEWTPAYEELGHTGELGLAAIAGDLEAACRWQAYLLAAYVGQGVAVTFNGVRCPTTSAKELAEFVSEGDPGAQLFPCKFKAKSEPQAAHQWEVVAMILPNKGVAVGNLSTVNGVCCSQGSHVKYLRDIMDKAVGAKMQKLKSAGKNAAKVSMRETCKHLTFVIVAPIPGATWDAQNKRKLTVARKLLSPFQVATAVLGKIANKIAEYNLAMAAQGKPSRKGRKKSVDHDKYMPARKAGTAQSPKTTLIVTEGDSASTFARAILTTRKKGAVQPKRGEPSLTFEWYGIMTTGGVPMNALRFTSETKNATGGTIVTRMDKLNKNVKLNSLMEVLGLQYECTYESDEEVSSLRYGRVVIATDQDVDGVGKILPLLLVFFHRFWPALLRRGYLHRVMTPLIRAYPKKKGSSPVEFFYDPMYAAWSKTVDASAYTVRYYKGLATHSDKEVAIMHGQFHTNTYQIDPDDECTQAFIEYYAKDPSFRKTILSKPFVSPPPEYFEAEHRTKITRCTDLLRHEATLYKLDDIERKIPSFSDGLYISSRKILAGAIKCFASSNSLKKVFQLGGYVADKMAYHHGDASLNGGIVNMAQRYPGGKRYPYLVGAGQFGTRHLGGKDAGSPRYIEVRLAPRFVRAMFPPQDTCLLDYVFEDGERAQPRNFLPVLPPIIESMDLPAEGWIHRSYARDMTAVLKLLRAYISGDELVHRITEACEASDQCTLRELFKQHLVTKEDLTALATEYPLPASTRGFGTALTEAEMARYLRPGQSPTNGKCMFSWGVYDLIDAKGRDIIHLKELPMGMKTEKLKSIIKAKTLSAKNPKGLVKKVIDDSPTDQIDIYIELVDGGLDEIRRLKGRFDDPIAEYFMVRAALWPHLNFFDSKLHRVREFGQDYWSVFMAWAPDRRDMYRHRLEREDTVLGLRIRMQDAIVRYIDMAADMAMGKKASEEEQVAALEAAEFPRYDSGLLRSPGFTPTADLVELVTLGPKASHDYILNLRERDLARTARDRRVKEVEKLAEEQKIARGHLGDAPFAGATIWAREVDAVVAAIKEGDRTDWWGDV